MLKVRLAKAPGVKVSILSNKHNRVGIPPVVYVESNAYEKYTGRYLVTPTAEEQILETTDRVLLENVRIAPIPSNYGLITYNGSELTIT